MKKKLVKISRLTVKKVFDPFYAGAAAEVSFFLLLSLVPATILLAQVLNLFTISLDAIRDVLFSYLSEEVLEIITPLLNYRASATVSVLLIILALWSGSRALFSMMRIANYALHGGSPFTNPFAGYVRVRIRAILAVILVLATMVFTINILVFGEVYIEIAVKYLIDFLGQDTDFRSIWYTLRWIIAFALYFLMVSSIYFILPTRTKEYSKQKSSSKFKNLLQVIAEWLNNQKTMYKMILPGSVFSTVTMLIATWVYAYYVRNIAFSNFNILYGSLSSIVVLLIWFYVLSFILIIGIQLNAAIQEYNNMQEKQQ